MRQVTNVACVAVRQLRGEVVANLRTGHSGVMAASLASTSTRSPATNYRPYSAAAITARTSSRTRMLPQAPGMRRLELLARQRRQSRPAAVTRCRVPVALATGSAGSGRARLGLGRSLIILRSSGKHVVPCLLRRLIRAKSKTSAAYKTGARQRGSRRSRAPTAKSGS